MNTLRHGIRCVLAGAAAVSGCARDPAPGMGAVSDSAAVEAVHVAPPAAAAALAGAGSDAAPRQWSFGGVTAPVDTLAPAHGLAGIAHVLVADTARGDFATLVALERAIRELQASAGSSLELEMLRLDVTDAAAHRLDGADYTAAVMQWIEQRDDLLIHFEAGGLFFVDPDAYLELLERYPSTPVAESVVWRASRQPYVHCEDDSGCWLGVGVESAGRYLERYPAGVHVDEALVQLQELTAIAADYACFYDGAPAPAEDDIARARRFLERVRSPQREAVLADLRTIERKCGVAAGETG